MTPKLINWLSEILDFCFSIFPDIAYFKICSKFNTDWRTQFAHFAAEIVYFDCSARGCSRSRGPLAATARKQGRQGLGEEIGNSTRFGSCSSDKIHLHPLRSAGVGN